MSEFYSINPGGNEIPAVRGIARWLLEAKIEGATHMVVVCDTFDYGYFPVNVMPEQDVREVEKDFDGKVMRTVVEVYWLGGDIEEQLNSPRTFRYGPEQV